LAKKKDINRLKIIENASTSGDLAICKRFTKYRIKKKTLIRLKNFYVVKNKTVPLKKTI